MQRQMFPLEMRIDFPKPPWTCTHTYFKLVFCYLVIKGGETIQWWWEQVGWRPNQVGRRARGIFCSASLIWILLPLIRCSVKTDLFNIFEGSLWRVRFVFHHRRVLRTLWFLGMTWQGVHFKQEGEKREAGKGMIPIAVVTYVIRASN